MVVRVMVWILVRVMVRKVRLVVSGVWWGGGLFDYSVYSWSSFNQKRHGRTRQGSGKDQELDNKSIHIFTS